MENKEVNHDGVVMKIDGPSVTVKMTVNSACHACHAKALCGVSESQDKTIVAQNINNLSFEVGETVRVELRQSLAAKAVVVCYLLPFVVLIASFCSMYAFCKNELVNVLVSLCCTALYFFFVWLFRSKIEKNVTFTVSKIPQI